MRKNPESINKKELTIIRLRILIVNYYCATKVAELVSQLKVCHLPRNVELSIVCIDNSCCTNQRSSLEKLKINTEVPFKLMFNDKNIGFGQAVNIGANDLQFDYLCCLNPDVTLRSDTIFNLVSYAIRHNTKGIWGGVTVDNELKPDFRHAWQEPTLKNTIGWAFGLKHIFATASWQDNYEHFPFDTNTPYIVDCISGCCMLISAQAWTLLNGFDSDYFLYSEEVDLCKRGRNLGFQPTVVPSALLHHTRHSCIETIRRLNIIYTAKILYISKHHNLLYTLIYRVLILSGSLIRCVKFLLTGQRLLAQKWGVQAWHSITFQPNFYKHPSTEKSQ